MSIIREVNLDTNEVIDREMTKDELALVKSDKLLIEKNEAIAEKAQLDKATAMAKLEALGLTAEDLKALGL